MTKIITFSSLTEEDFPLLAAFVEGCITQNYDQCLELITTFSSFTRLETSVRTASQIFSPSVDEWLQTLKLKCQKKFPLLVLVDLGGTIFFRSDDKAMKGAQIDFKKTKYMYFLRPGHKEFLKKVSSHPRVKLGFYSSIMFKNIQPVMLEIL